MMSSRSLANTVKLDETGKVPLYQIPDEVLTGKTMEMIATRSSVGIWTLAGVAIKKPILITFPSNEITFDILSGTKDSTGITDPRALGSWKSGRDSFQNVWINPTKSTVTIQFWNISGVVRAYQ